MMLILSEQLHEQSPRFHGFRVKICHCSCYIFFMSLTEIMNRDPCAWTDAFLVVSVLSLL